MERVDDHCHSLEDNPMSFTRRKFVIGMGTVIFHRPSQNLLASTGSLKPFVTS